MAIENIYIIFNFNFNPHFFKLITTLIPTLIPTIMAPMELLQTKKIIKYDNGIITAIAIKKKLREYITTNRYIYIYKRSLQTIPYRLYSRKNSIGLLPITLKKIHFKLKAKL